MASPVRPEASPPTQSQSQTGTIFSIPLASSPTLTPDTTNLITLPPLASTSPVSVVETAPVPPSSKTSQAEGGLNALPATPTLAFASTPTVEPVPTVTPEPTATAVPTATPQPTATPKPTAMPTPRPATLEIAIQSAIDRSKTELGKEAEYGIVIHNLDTNEKVAINQQKMFNTASIYKLFVMLTVYYDISQGKLSLDDRITLTPDAADIDDDGGVLIVPVGESLPVKDLLYAMITSSNNTASLMLMFQVKIPHMRQVVADLGFKGTDLSDTFNIRSTPDDLDQFMNRLANQKLLGAKYDPAMLDLLVHQQVRDRIPALLPADTRVANKTGNIDDITNDTGLVFLPKGGRIAITIMVRQSDGTSARKFISQLSLAAYNYYTVN